MHAAWHGDRLHETCFREVHAVMRTVPQTGTLRRGQTKTLGTVGTPFGNVELSVSRSPDTMGLDIQLDHYHGRMLNCEGVVSGRCTFSTYRTIRGRGWLTNDKIFFCMDATSQEASEWYELLRYEDDSNFEEEFNTEGLLTADEIWISPELRGSSAWKVLYFSTMSTVFLEQRRLYQAFVFKAHPLIDRDELGKMSKQAIQKQAQDLRRLYAVQLNAWGIWQEGKPTMYMRAGVPGALFRAWYSIQPTGRH